MDDENSYQYKALQRTCEQDGINDVVGTAEEEEAKAKEVMLYYALYCIYAATSRTSNPFLEQNGQSPNPWLITNGWEAVDVHPCAGWYGVECDGNTLTELDLHDLYMTGTFPPEVKFLAKSGQYSKAGAELKVLDLYYNKNLYNVDSTWVQDLEGLGK